MAKYVKRDKVIRTYDGIDREESTAGLMALRVIIILVIIAFITCAATLFVYNFQKETEDTIDTVSTVESGAFYQQFDDEQNEKLLVYCNNSVSISEYYSVELSIYNDDVQVSSLMLDSLKKMIEAAKKDGVQLDVVQGYMSYDECNTKYHSIMLKLEEEGATLAESESKARSVFPQGGNNEYQTGMLIKMSNDESGDFSKTDAYAWLYKNGVNYGFINRYTDDKISYTGIEEDLTVFRFVGTENAQKMRSFGMCLEEYYDYCSYR